MPQSKFSSIFVKVPTIDDVLSYAIKQGFPIPKDNGGGRGSFTIKKQDL